MSLKAVVLLLTVLHSSTGRIRVPVEIVKRAGPGLTAAQTKSIVDGHNEQRRKVGGANIEILTWNTYLAQLAQESSDTCVSGSPIPKFDSTKFPGIDTLGQNSFAGTGYTKLDTALIIGLDLWYSKVATYDPATGSCGGSSCGGATQVLWYNSKSIGCGATTCPGTKTVVTCLYAPPGNYVGQKAFVKGDACSKCSSGKGWCNNGLCNSACTKAGSTCVCKAKCLNGGTVKTATCTCACANGWMGADCSEKCQNTNAYCNAGWPPGLCKIQGDPIADYARKYCPLMCGACKA